ncbi:DNA-3-methyladenine glycosylase [Pseudorhodobacter sp.]|uniref:DNA-3-methyladenine glycosylase n=1 Tax=Pseudorhodobacter sp. TaxID=1934400 RepID=UPI002AFE30B3|nr:DNA-3-methyladenine glycosylase [Pseudorhodobacter sp.]
MQFGGFDHGAGAGGSVIETESYGQDDPASHSFRGPALRNASMFGPAGQAYVYRSYGIHLCLNIVARPGEAVLLRALCPTLGLDLMQTRCGPGSLCNDLGRLGQALGICSKDDGVAFDSNGFSINLPASTPKVLTGTRIGISKAQDMPWRFGLARAKGLSRRF